LNQLEKTMTNFTKLAAGLTGLAAIAAVASPATAQIDPYGQVSPYGAPNNGGVVGAVVNALTGQYPQGNYGQYPQGNYGYGQYPQGNYGYEQASQRNSVEMCARTAEQRLNTDGRYAGYNSGYGRNAYAQNGYGNGGSFRVVGITNVERRMNGALRVRGIASSDLRHGNAGWNGQGAYGQYANNGNYPAGMDYRFTCKVDSRGAVTSLNLDRGTPSMRG
jgi:hypothetical protein